MKKAIVVFVFCAVLAALADNPHVTSLAQLVDVALTTPANGDTLTFDGPSGKWVNKPASAASNGPQIVVRFDQDGITGDINTPLFTASETATYRVTFYGNTTAIDITQPLPFFVNATVSSSLTNAGTAFSINHQGLTIHQCDSSLLRVNAGESPTLSVINTANVSTGLHIVVEKL
jgi:hypothetical protein